MTYKDPDKQREAQRDWVRQKRAEQGSTKQRPARLAPIPIPCEIKPKRDKDIKPQSYNSMMVGYVPPREV